MIREIDLMTYLPPRMQEYYELQKITATENLEFQQLWNVNEQMRRDLFIMTAGEIGIERWEKMLNLFPPPDDILEDRRAKILIRINEKLPYSIRVLQNTLRIICGDDNFKISLNEKEYVLKIKLDVFSNGITNSIDEMLKRIIPANLICILEGDLANEAVVCYHGAVLSTITHTLSGSVKL